MHRVFLLLPLLFLLLTAQAPEQQTIPSGATGGANAEMYSLGYLNCTAYANVDNAGGGTPKSGTRPGCKPVVMMRGRMRWRCIFPVVPMIDDTLKLYEWQNWSGSAALTNPPQVYSIRGSHVGSCQPEIKLAASASAFDNAGAPRPMMALRAFWALNSSATANQSPSNPLGLPSANWKDGQANSFMNVIENIHFNTNGHAGAIGLTAPGAQNSGIYNIKVTATNSFAGIYGLPGRNSVAGNIEVIGGQHCIGGGSVWGSQSR